MSTTFMPQNFYDHNASTAPQSFYTSASNSMQQEQRPPRPPYRPSNRPILCYRCGEYGHYQSKCALPEGSPPCHHCPDSRDHYSKDCPKQRASSSSGSTQNQEEFTFPKINLITVNTIPQPSPATHVVDPQQVGESAGVLTRAQRAALGLSLPTRLSPPSPIPQHVSSNESFTGAKSRPNSILSDIDGAFLEAAADLQQIPTLRLFSQRFSLSEQATTDCTLWAMDRVTFRNILLQTTSSQRKVYERFLEDVPLLKSLDKYERAAISDVLKTEYFEAGQNIIVEGQAGDRFYLLEEEKQRQRKVEKFLCDTNEETILVNLLC
ncbi:hypothetical protein L7F22_009920 [Adiantum nelumboides]|nr:hypothetical protein [Adiantum nelumboides]